MDRNANAEARLTLAMAGASRAPLAAGLTFSTPEMLAALSREASYPEAVAAVCRELDLDFAFVASWLDGASDTAAAVDSTGTAVMWVVPGPLGMVLERMGWTEGLLEAASDPESMRVRLDDALEPSLERVRQGVSLGAAAIVIADDLASGSGPLVPPDFAYDEVFPRLERLVTEARASDIPAVLHCDGDARVFLSAAKRAGFTALHGGGGLGWDGFERLFAAARKTGLAVVGGLLTADLTRGAPAAVAGGAKAGLLARSGGLLVADDGGLTGPVEMASFVAALAQARMQASTEPEE